MPYVTSHIKKVFSMMNTHIEEKLTPAQKIGVLFDMACSMCAYGMGINDYFTYRFYKRDKESRKTFIVYSKRIKIIKMSNDKRAMRIFDDKKQFNTIFADYIKRDWIFARDVTFAEFNSFLDGKEKIFIKPVVGSHGKGVAVIAVSEINDRLALYNDMCRRKLIAEEVIAQSHDMQQFNATSVNSLRIVTMLHGNGDVSVMTANIRFGNAGKIADNFHHAGLAATVDTKTGMITTLGIDKAFNRYEMHPVSGLKIPGYVIPNWAEILEFVKSAARVEKRVRYVGWDVALNSDNEPVIIEGNAKADPDITQIPDMTGKYPLYVPILEEYRQEKKRKRGATTR